MNLDLCEVRFGPFSLGLSLSLGNRGLFALPLCSKTTP
jgi:hypothetical protein